MPIQRAKPKLTDIRGGTPLTSSSSIVTSQLPAGTILKHQKVTWNDITQSQSDSFTDITNGTLSYTPVSASSTLRITANIYVYFGQGSSTTVGGAIRLVHDGTALNSPGSQQYYKSAGSGTAILQVPHLHIEYVSAGSTSARTIKVQARCYAGSNAAEFVINKLNQFYSNIEVLEIAG